MGKLLVHIITGVGNPSRAVLGFAVAKAALDDGHQVLEIPEAVEQADIIHVLIPDMEQPKLYEEHIKPYLKDGNALGFSHGLVINY